MSDETRGRLVVSITAVDFTPRGKPKIAQPDYFAIACDIVREHEAIRQMEHTGLQDSLRKIERGN